MLYRIHQLDVMTPAQRAMKPLSLLYSAALNIYLKWRLPRQYHCDAFVISVGNIAFGGAAKTPTTITLAKYLQQRGHRVAILSRGYRGQMSRRGGVVSDGQRLLATVAQAGDEPYLMAQSLPGVPVLVGKDRRRTARYAIEHFDCDVLLLDDGFQYWQLARDVDLVMLNARRPFGNGWPAPSGHLREPVSSLFRASALLLDDNITEGLVSHHIPDRPLFVSKRMPTALLNILSGERLPVTWLRQRNIVTACAVARPRQFERTLSECGAQMNLSLRLPDHTPMRQEQLQEICNDHDARHAEALVITVKDAVKLDESTIKSLRLPVYALEIEMEIEDRFWSWLEPQLPGPPRSAGSQTDASASQNVQQVPYPG